MLQGYNKLPPAHALRFDLQSGQAQVWPYWQLPDLASEHGAVDDESLLDELEALLQESVSAQMTADVPVGILLSGGVDSSLVTAMAVRASSQVQTFSIGFPGHGKADETEHARLIARHFGTRHTELMAEDASADLLPRLARQFDEPIIDSSMVPTFLVSQLVRQNCTVALGGDGGDELFGGFLLKRLCSRLLPPEFDLQRKQGFSIPMNVWLKGGPFRTLFDDVLRDPQCSFDAQTVNKLMRDQDKGHFNGERLFGLVMFELWRREYGISF